MTQRGEARAPLFLARFTMLATERLGNGAVAQQLIDAAAEDMTCAASY